MNELTNNMQTGLDMFQRLQQNAIDIIPGIIGALLYLLTALVVYKVIIYALNKVLSRINMEKYVQKYFSQTDTWKVKINPSAVILGLTRFTLIIILIVLGSEILGFSIISHELSNLLSFMPKIVSSLILLLVGIYISGAASRMLYTLLDSFDLAGARILSKLAGFIILFIISLIAIELLGIDTRIITDNLSIILGAIMICVSIAIGLGSVEIVKRILFGFYFKKNFSIGQYVEFNDISGEIIRMDNISIVIQQEKSNLVIPIKDLVDSQVKILSNRG